MLKIVKNLYEKLISRRELLIVQKEKLTSAFLRFRKFNSQLFRGVWTKFHFYFPRLVPSPYKGEKEHYAKRDLEENVESRAPSEEEVRLSALWGVEIYGPAEIDSLYSSLEKLGWNEDSFFFQTTPGAWINEMRTYGSEGHLNLSTIVRPGKEIFLGESKKAELPDIVEYAHGYIYQLSPAVTAIFICFVLNESASKIYEDQLNIDRHTERRPLKKGGYRIFGVEHLKRQAIDIARTRYRKVVVQWFSSNLPGLFSSSSDGNRLPTTEIITTKSQLLLDKGRLGKHTMPEWAQLLTPYGSTENWFLKDSEWLGISWFNTEGDERYHSIVALQTNLIPEEQLKYSGKPGKDAYASYVSDKVEGVLVNYAATAALMDIIRFLRITSSDLSPVIKSRKGVVKSLEKIRLFFDWSVGLPAFASEMASRSEEIRSYKWECESFMSVPWREEDKPVEISEALRYRTNTLATRAINIEKETREHLEQLSSIFSTRENIRTQSRMEWVAIAATIVSIASLITAVMSVEKFAAYIEKQIDKISLSK